MKSGEVYTKQQRIAELAKQMPEAGFTSLAYRIDLEWLKEAYRRTRKDGAAGVDEVTAAQYEEELESNLSSLLDRFKTGSYYAPPVKRVYIPKEAGGERTRPIGIPTLEDKILQRAVVMLLTPLFEQDFLDCSYGFRPERSAHQALEALWHVIMRMGGCCWVLEIDIKSYFDTVKWGHLREFYKKRVRDSVVNRVLGKWLKAGVMEDGAIHYPQEGTPQGGVISPLLANIYLHEVLDVWFDREVRPRLRGKAELVRFADDFVIVFSNEADAHRVLEVLPKRFERFGLTIQEEKTRLVDFSRPGEGNEPGSFDLLGFTHYWGKSRKGNWVVQRKTAKKKLKQSVRRVYEWCKENRHVPVKEQWEALRRKVQGHYGYYGVTFNMRGIKSFYEQVKRSWHKWLNRRSRDKDMPWERFNRLLERYPLPQPRIVHQYS
ncbi:MAG: group II intron reverse transcriptase/maturase [Thermodesulfobacteriota bacterium]